MTKATLLVQDEFFDASAPLQKGQIADFQSHNLMITGGGGGFPVEGVIYIGEFVVKGAAVTYPDEHILQPYAVKEPVAASVAGDVVGFTTLHCNAISAPTYDRPALTGAGTGKAMAKIALVGGGVIAGAISVDAVTDGAAVNIYVDDVTLAVPVGTISATGGAGYVTLSSTFVGAASAGLVRIKL
tara:strand:- start:220 stop:774 length:555 start_codon:yes stop_codon:yes gene_type:complete